MAAARRATGAQRVSSASGQRLGWQRRRRTFFVASITASLSTRKRYESPIPDSSYAFSRVSATCAQHNPAAAVSRPRGRGGIGRARRHSQWRQLTLDRTTSPTYSITWMSAANAVRTDQQPMRCAPAGKGTPIEARLQPEWGRHASVQRTTSSDSIGSWVKSPHSWISDRSNRSLFLRFLSCSRLFCRLVAAEVALSEFDSPLRTRTLKRQMLSRGHGRCQETGGGTAAVAVGFVPPPRLSSPGLQPVLAARGLDLVFRHDCTTTQARTNISRNEYQPPTHWKARLGGALHSPMALTDSFGSKEVIRFAAPAAEPRDSAGGPRRKHAVNSRNRLVAKR